MSRLTIVPDFRRYLRPFFLDPTTQKPTPYKRYYDWFSWLVTQLAFCFVTTPFLVLHFSDCIKVWADVYFYCIVGVSASYIFFWSPARQWLKVKIEERSKEAGVQLKKSASTESLATGGSMDREPLVGPGLTSDVDREVGQLVGEAKMAWQERERLRKRL